MHGHGWAWRSSRGTGASTSSAERPPAATGRSRSRNTTPPRTHGPTSRCSTRCVEHRCGAGRQLHLRAGWIRRCRRAHQPCSATTRLRTPSRPWRRCRLGTSRTAWRPQGTKIYVLGGAVDWVRGHDEPDLRHRRRTRWSTGAAVPTAVQYPAAASDGTYVYLLGGNTTNLNIVQRYDPAANTWTTRANDAHRPGRPGCVLRRHERLGRRRWLDELTSRAPSRTTRPRTPGPPVRRWPPACARSARPSATTWP